jgi:copper chaperone CopZ
MMVIALRLVSFAEDEKPALPKVAKGCVRSTMEVNFCCEGCASNAREAVEGLKGVAFVATDLETKQLTVDYKEKQISLRKIKDAILAAGYSVDGEEPKE